MSLLSLHPLFAPDEDISHITNSLTPFFASPSDGGKIPSSVVIDFWSSAHRVQTAWLDKTAAAVATTAPSQPTLSPPPTVTTTTTTMPSTAILWPISLSSRIESLPENFRTGDGCESMVALDAVMVSIKRGTDLVAIDWSNANSVSAAVSVLRKILDSKNPSSSASPPPSFFEWGEWGIQNTTNLVRKISSVALNTVKSIGNMVDLVDADDSDTMDGNDQTLSTGSGRHHHKPNSEYLSVPLLMDVLSAIQQQIRRLQDAATTPSDFSNTENPSPPPPPPTTTTTTTSLPNTVRGSVRRARILTTR